MSVTVPVETPRHRRYRHGFYRMARVILRAHVRLFYAMEVIDRTEGRLSGVEGAMVVANHCCILDSVMVAEALPHHYLRFLSLAENVGNPVYGPVVRALGAIAVGGDLRGTRAMVRSVDEAMAEGEWPAVFPEGNLRHYERSLQPFREGAFRMAVTHGVPLVVVTLVPRDRSCLNRLVGGVAFDVVVGPVIEPDTLEGTPRRRGEELMERARRAMVRSLLWADGTDTPS